MKICPNSNCIIYTRLDELPDTYTRCPQCGTPLVESAMTSGRLDSSMLAEEDTSPYAAPSRPVFGPASATATRQQAVTYEEITDPYDVEAYEDEEPPAEPLPTVAPRPAFALRGAVVAVGLIALVVACTALAVSLGGRFFVGSSQVGGPLATQTAVSGLHPPINTPITILPTLAVSAGGQDTSANANPRPTSGVPAGDSLAQAGVSDALMCARLDGGKPVGTTQAYKPQDTFNLAVKADYGPGGVIAVLTRWYGPDGKQIYDMKQTYSQPGSYYAGFTLTKSTPWLPGDYRVDIYTNNTPEPARSVQFSVVP